MPKRKPPIPMYFTSLEIENVRCFGGRQSLDLTGASGRSARWTLIVGDNGVGKTTLLQCLAWMRPEPETRPAERESASGEPAPLTKGRLGPALEAEENDVFESLLRKGHHTKLSLGAKLSFGGTLSSMDEDSTSATRATKAISLHVQVVFTSRRLSDVKSRRRPRIETMLDGEFHEPMVVAYGANRLLGKQNLATGELNDPVDSYRLYGLTELYDIEEILTNLDYASSKVGDKSREHKELKRLLEVLANMLPEEFKPDDVKIFPPDVLDSGQPSGVQIKTSFGQVPLSALSLGYQTTLAWTTDLAWRLLQRYSGSENPLAEPAVVLIDEIDLHLHPLWQLRIIDDLSAIFSGTQFVATAHSPLMVQVAETANFVLLRKRQTDVEIVNDPEDVRSWRVDQILASELFEIPRARDRQTERLFERRDKLVDKPSLTAADEAELTSLRARISDLPTAQNPDDQKAMDFIRQAAALLKKKKIGQA